MFHLRKATAHSTLSGVTSEILSNPVFGCGEPSPHPPIEPPHEPIIIILD